MERNDVEAVRMLRAILLLITVGGRVNQGLYEEYRATTNHSQQIQNMVRSMALQGIEPELALVRDYRRRIDAIWERVNRLDYAELD